MFLENVPSKENANIHHVAKRGQPSQWGRGGQCQSKIKSIVPKVKSNYNKLRLSKKFH